MLKSKIPEHYKAIARDSIGLLLADLIYRSSNILTIWLIAHYLGPTTTGIYTLASTFRLTLQILTLAGTGYLIVRELSVNQIDAQKYLLNFTGVRLILSLFSWLLLCCAISFLPYPKIVFILVGLELFPEAIREITRSSFIAQQRILSYALIASFTGLARIIACWGTLFIGQGLIVVAASVTFVSWIGNWFCLLKLPFSFRNLWPSISFTIMKAQILASVPFLSINVLLVIYAQSNVYLLSLLSTLEDIAFYSISDSIVASSSLLTQVYLSVAIPTFSKMRFLNKRLEVTYARSLLILSGLAFPIAASVSFQAINIASLWGLQFQDASRVIGLLIWSLAISWLNAPNSGVMIATGYERISARFLALALGVNLVAGLILIPFRGAVGAAIARLMAELVFVVMHWLFVHRKVSRTPIGILSLPLIALIAMGLTRSVFGLLLNTWVALGISLLIYITILLLGLFFSRRYQCLLTSS